MQRDAAQDRATKALKRAGFDIQMKPVTKVEGWELWALDPDVLKYLKDLTALEEFHLINTHISDRDLRHLEGLKSLATLELKYNNDISDAGMVHLRGLTQLRSLNINNTRVGDAGLKAAKKPDRIGNAGASGHAHKRFRCYSVTQLCEIKKSGFGGDWAYRC